MDQGVTYEEYLAQPDWFINAHAERFFAKGSSIK